jgi:3-methylfumaryl-CoA hydratase
VVSGLASALAGWAPPPVTVTDRIDPWPVAAFAALLDVPAPAGTMPPLWHWFSFLETVPQAELGEDGHPAHGHFLPPVPDRRRMIAGGRLSVRAPLPLGATVTRRSALADVSVKSGQTGEMAFVTVRHELCLDGAVAVVEEQDVVYRSQPAGTAPARRHEVPVAVEPEPAAAGSWRLRLDPDEAMLFRFSALTYNAHRIHYDRPYVTSVEGYPGLVVHGPLLALLALELPRRFAPERPVTAFEYRLQRPVFAGSAVVADGFAGDDDGVIGVTVAVPGQPPSLTGTLRVS